MLEVVAMKGYASASVHPAMPRLAQDCAELLTQYVIGDDKETAHVRLKEEPSRGNSSRLANARTLR